MPTKKGKAKKNANKRKRGRNIDRGSSAASQSQRLQASDARYKSISSGMPYRLSECAAKYLGSLVDPFESPPGACIPTWPNMPSYKVRGFVRGSLTVGTAGVGFIWGRLSLAADDIAYSYTGSTFAGTSLSSAPTVGVTSGYWGNLPYATANFGPSGYVQGRYVSGGFRVRYTGTELDRGGTIVTLEEPAHQSLSGQTCTQLLYYEQAHRFEVSDGEWTQVCFMPVSINETQYSTVPNGGITGVGYLAIMIVAKPGVTFDWEASADLEYIGDVARGKTPAHADTSGMQSVLGGLRETNDGVVDRKLYDVRAGRKHPTDLPHIMRSISNYAMKTVSGFIPGAKPILSIAKKVFDI